MVDSRPIQVVPVDIPLTARLHREAERWAGSARPTNIVSAGPGQISVWSFPRPPAVERVLERVEVHFAGQRIAATDRAVRVCETASPPTYYIPPADVNQEYFCRDVGESMCEWKGLARYYALVAGDQRAAQAAWAYPTPFDEFAMLAGFVSFYPARVDWCSVGGEIVQPQPGRFYGGWVTGDLTGPFKGEPGSAGW
ncbi:MAG: DUF427 domain-containing protein [Proteobacteria bacterium]|nr:DUF427 domain-containing protein [Pseudomonadota bacterium]